MRELNVLYDDGRQFGAIYKAITPQNWDAKTDLVEIVEYGARLQPALNRRFDEAMKPLHDATEIRTFLSGFCAGYNGCAHSS